VRGGGTGVRNGISFYPIYGEKAGISLFVRLFVNEKRKGGGHDLFLRCVWRTIANAIRMWHMSLLVLLK
jgi:hypothetical protein